MLIRLTKVIIRFCFVTCLMTACSTSIAAGIDSGEQAYERCALCHGLYGFTPRSKFPILAGQNPVYLESQLRAFLAGQRTNDGGQMQGVVTEITDDQISEVVEWFSNQDLPPHNAEPVLDAEVLYQTAGCADCHLENRSAQESVPLLFAQHKAYLEKQMRNFRDGQRNTDADIALHQQLTTLSDTDLDLIASYLATQERKP